jgi:uncharacterized alpha-E superfamily protein
MLSRVADSLYWSTRYVERAEGTSRLLHVNFHALLDADIQDHGRSWQELLLMVGMNDLYREHFDEYAARHVTEFLLWHPANPDSVAACVSHARENARGVREQISTEVWEQLNRLHLFLTTHRTSSQLARPHEFLTRIVDRSYSIQGVIKATLPRGEAYEFLELGSLFERADSIARILSVKVSQLLEPGSEQVVTARATHVLRSAGSLEAFRKAENDRFAGHRAVEFLLLDRNGPRTVLFCLERALNAIRVISGAGVRPERAIGRVVSELAFADVVDRSAGEISRLLARTLAGIRDGSDEIANAYFTTRVIMPGPYAQHQQQQ